MLTSLMSDIDFIEELRLRRWARENYVPVAERPRDLHPIVREEMSRKDEESYTEEPLHSYTVTTA